MCPKEKFQEATDIYAYNPVTIIGQMATLLIEQILSQQTGPSYNSLRNHPCQNDIQ